MNELVACIVEGASERAIINILLDNELLVFSRDDLLDDNLLSDQAARKAKTFEKRYLSRGFSVPIVIYRILDNPRSDRFELSPAYREKVRVVNVVTSPEIEMLIIFAENAYKDYSKIKSKVKPSDYCKITLKMPDRKKYDWVMEYFSDVDKLLFALKEYNRCTKKRKGELTLFDLLKR